MRKLTGNQKKNQVLKERNSNNAENKTTNDNIGSSGVKKKSKLNKSNTRGTVLKDQTNLLTPNKPNISSASPVVMNLPKYDLRRIPTVNYKKLADVGDNEGPSSSVNIDKNKDTIKGKILEPITNNSIITDVKNTPKLKANINKITSALKPTKPVYNIHNFSSKNKKSMPIEGKLDVYNFEVDENELIPVRKKKRNLKRKNVEKGVKFKNNIVKIINKNVPNSKCMKNAKVLSEQNLKPLIQNQTTSISKSVIDDNIVFETLQVPILFHNDQNGTSFIKNDNSKKEKNNDNNSEIDKPGFSAMSDDENKNDLNKLEHYFKPHCKTPKKNDNTIGLSENLKNDETLKDTSIRSMSSSFYRDSIIDFNINASTPVKYYNNSTCNSSTIENCFGFDEPEVFEEPLISPIRNNNEKYKNNKELSKLQQSQDNHKKAFSYRKEEIPVKQVIKLLNYGVEKNDETSNNSLSPNSILPIFEDPVVNNEQEESMKENRITKPPPRRSYERPEYLRKKHKSFQDNSSEGSDEENVKSFIPKKKQGQTKKEQNEMQKWIKAFNSQCQEVENFHLVVE